MSQVIDPYCQSEALPQQEQFHSSNAAFRAYVGGYGSGKTYSGSWEAWMLSQMFPGTVGIVCRNTYGELKDSTQATFFRVLAEITEAYTGKPGDIYNPETCPLVKSFNKTANDLVLYTAGLPSMIMFRSLDNPGKFKSAEIGWFWIDEASDTDEEAFLILMGRLRHPAMKGHYTGFLTTNPCNDRHWLYRRFVTETSDDYALFRAPTSENPYLPEGYEETLRASYNEDWVKRYLEGEFGFIAEGERVYPEFDEKRHVRPVKYNPRLPVVRSWDFGWYHPAVVIAQIDGDKLCILKEIQGKAEIIETFAERVLKFCKKEFGSTSDYEDYCDPAGNQQGDKNPNTSVEILRSMGIYPRSRFQHILDGVQIIKMLLHKNGGLVIDPSCRILKEGFLGGYHYPEKYDGSGEEPKPFKDGHYDHLQDCIRYLVWNTKFRRWLKSLPNEIKTPGSFDYWKKLDGKVHSGAISSIRI